MDVFTRTVQKQRPEVPDGYFHVTRAGWLRIGVGSAATTKILIRVRGPSNDPADDVLLEAKALRSLAGLGCLQMPSSSPTFRVIAGNQQIGRLKHAILLGAPEIALPEVAAQGEHLRDWWIRSWDPSYREVNLDDLRSVEDLSAIVFDSGVQLGAGSVRGRTASEQTILRQQSLAAIDALEAGLRKEARDLVLRVVARVARIRRPVTNKALNVAITALSAGSRSKGPIGSPLECCTAPGTRDARPSAGSVRQRRRDSHSS